MGSIASDRYLSQDGEANSVRETAPIAQFMDKLKMAIAALLLCASAQATAISEEWIRYGGTISQAEENAMNRQKAASKEELFAYSLNATYTHPGIWIPTAASTTFN